MWKLLAADLRALRNLFEVAQGRRLLATHALGYLCYGLAGLFAGGRLLASDPVRAALLRAPEVAAPAMHSLLLLLPIAAAAALTWVEARRKLFSEPLGVLLRVAPVLPMHIVLRALAVCASLSWVLALAIGWPSVALLASGGLFGFAAVALYPVLSACVTLGLAGLSLCLVVLLRRFMAGQRAMLALNAVGALVAIVLVLVAASGFSAGDRAEAGLARFLERPATLSVLGWLAAPGQLLARAGGHACSASALDAGLQLLVWPLLTLLGVALACGVYPSSAERGLAHGADAPRGRPGSAAGWPSGPGRVAASFRKKDMIVVTRERASLVAFAFLGVWAAWSAGVGELVSTELAADLPASCSQGLALASKWTLFVGVLGCLQGMSFLDDELAQRELLATSPCAASRLLAGKLPSLVLPQAWVAIVLVLAASFGSGVEGGALLVFGLLAPPIAAGALAVVVGIGSHPALLQRGSAPASSKKSEPVLIKVLFVTAGVFGLAFAELRGLVELRALGYEHFSSAAAALDEAAFWRRFALIVAGFWVLAGGLLVGAWLAGRRHVAQLLGPLP